MRIRKNNPNQKLVKEANFFKYRYVNLKTNTKTSWRVNAIYYHLLILVAICLIVWILYLNSSSIKFENFENVIEKLKLLFRFDNKSNLTTGEFSTNYTNLFLDSLKLLWLTIKFALTGTFFGFILALITAYLSFDKTTNKYLAFIISVFILFLRAIPELVFITLITGTFRNELSLLLVYLWFTWLWLHKYYLEMLNSFDLEWYYNSINQGNSKFKAFIKEIFPRIKNRVVALFIFSFESNIRWSSILGALSLPGIGLLINYASKSTHLFNQLAIPLTVLMVFILFLELVNYLFKKHLLEAKTKLVFKQKNETKAQYYNRLTKNINFNKWITIAIFAFVTIVSIVTLTTTPLWLFNLTSVKEFLKNFFNPDFSKFSFTTNQISQNPILLFWNSFSFAITGIVLCVILTLISIRLQSLSLNKTYQVVIFRSINVFIRLIPVIVIFYIFKAIFDNTVTLLIICIALHQMSSQTKQLVELVDNLDQQVINNLKLQGYSNNQIFLKYVLPSIKIEFISLTVFYFELIFRSSITYSILASQDLLIGTQITNHLDPRNFHPQIALAYVWIGTVSILIVNLVGKLIVNKIKK
ncbi:PhnE/PtxC family ABC transporter permease [Mycoplasma putrefaciens]|uniref:ABC transporter, permease protein n=1 Tax=Mycoplasma putrefaciens (strain ATCC 15718 / NCTC 10155 / C30 KS-1 / KS-1) TaxID=743965 RepID=A0A7U3ZSL8_MYCPK|nr:ABC transporter permease subunit [Mycoplasma putrefaciens]AEM68773.1 ABC transporter, permease protein [Mycoplasma putrefaciens KS1]